MSDTLSLSTLSTRLMKRSDLSSVASRLGRTSSNRSGRAIYLLQDDWCFSLGEGLTVIWPKDQTTRFGRHEPQRIHREASGHQNYANVAIAFPLLSFSEADSE